MKFKDFYLAETFEYYKDRLKIYKNRDDIYFSFTHIFKIGINPKTKWNTPVGIYTYPTNMTSPIPFFGTMPNFVWFITPKKSTTCLDFDNYTEQRYKDDLLKLSIFFKKDFEPIDGTLFEKAKNIYQIINTSSYSVTKNVGMSHCLFNILGYDYVKDSGHGIIHRNEKTQTVFINPLSYNVLEVTDYKHRDGKENDIGKIIKNLSGTQLKLYVDNFKNDVRYYIKHSYAPMDFDNINEILKLLNMKYDSIGSLARL